MFGLLRVGLDALIPDTIVGRKFSVGCHTFTATQRQPTRSGVLLTGTDKSFGDAEAATSIILTDAAGRIEYDTTYAFVSMSKWHDAYGWTVAKGTVSMPAGTAPVVTQLRGHVHATSNVSLGSADMERCLAADVNAKQRIKDSALTVKTNKDEQLRQFVACLGMRIL